MSKEDLDFIKEFLDIMSIIADSPRQVGKTTALREAAEKINALFVVKNYISKKEDYDITLYEIKRLKNRSLGNYDEIERCGRPIIFDTYTLKIIFGILKEAINDLEDKIERLELNNAND